MARPSIFVNTKFKRLVATLGVPRPYVLGLLETMWHGCYENGSALLGSWQDVEAAAEWPGKPGVLFAALKAGRWIEHSGRAWAVHDLYENAPSYVKDRLRKQEARKKEKKT